MQITYNNTTINFWNFELPKKILLSLSGGLDSAAAAFLTCKHFPEIEIIPFNARDVNAPKDAVAAGNIVQWLQKEFSHVKIRDIEIYDFDDTNESFVSWAECDRAIKSVERQITGPDGGLRLIRYLKKPPPSLKLFLTTFLVVKNRAFFMQTKFGSFFHSCT